MISCEHAQEFQERGPQQEVQELPLVARGVSEADATVQGLVASVLDSLTGERHDIHVATPVPNLLNFNSIAFPSMLRSIPNLRQKFEPMSSLSLAAFSNEVLVNPVIT